MASIEKSKKKKAVIKESTVAEKLNTQDDKDTVYKSSSVISVKAATSTDQHDTVEKGSAEEARTKTPSSRPTSSASYRPLSAGGLSAQQNIPSSGAEPFGSMVSLKSREAWTDVDVDNSADNTLGTTGIRPSTAVSRTSETSTNSSGSRLFRPNNSVGPMPDMQPTSAHLAVNNSSSGMMPPTTNNTSVEPFTPVTAFGPAEMNESHAYVPYLYARDAIGKVVMDMTNMKVNHIRIVHDIEDNFRCIEDETQAQFNLFVLNLRDQYGVKVKTFRQVIEVHRLELQQKDQYWDELLMSLSQRNTELLRDKKMLLIQNKVEFERLEQEKKEAILLYTTKIDETNAANAKDLKEMANRYEERIKELETKHSEKIKTLTTEHEEEKKVTNDALVIEKAEVERLKRLLEKMQTEKEGYVSAGPVVITKQAAAEPTMAVADMSEEDRARMEETRLVMAAERAAMVGDRETMEKEREKFAHQRRKFQEDHALLQEEINTAHKEREQWHIRYESLKDHLSELAQIKAKYEALTAQFAAVSALAITAAVDDQAKTDEKIAKMEADRNIMLEEKGHMDRDIEKWEAKFKKKNGRAPTEDEKPDSIKELYISRAEAEGMVKRLDTQIETLKALKKGQVPQVAAVPVTPITIQEPEIKTVEVKVPDPKVVAALQVAEAEMDKLKSQITVKKDEQSKLRGNISELESELEQARAEISKCEAKVTSLEKQLAEGFVAGAAVAENKEMDARIKKAEKAKKGVEKDLKATLKAQAKTAAAAETSKKLLEITVHEAREVIQQAEKASDLINKRLKAAQALELGDQKEDHALTLQALEMLATGAVPEKAAPAKTEVELVSTAVPPDTEALEEKIDQLQHLVGELTTKKNELEGNNQDLETELADLRDKIASGDSLDPVTVAALPSAGDDVEELSEQMTVLQQQVDEAELCLAQEKSAHVTTHDKLEAAQAQLEALGIMQEEKEAMHAANMDSASDKSQAVINNLTLKLNSAESRVDELDKARLSNVPIDTQKEIKALKAKLAASIKEKDTKAAANVELQSEIKQMNVKIAALEKSSGQKKAASTESDKKLKELKAEKEKEMKAVVAKYEKREKDRAKQEEKKIGALEKKMQQLEMAGASGAGAAAAKPGKADKAGPDKAMMEKLRESQRENKDAQNRIKQLEKELKDAQKDAGSGNIEAEREKKKQEKILKELEKKLDMFVKKNEKNEANLKKQGEEIDTATKENTAKDREIVKLKSELDGLGVVLAEGLENAAKVKELNATVKILTTENKDLTDNYNSERVLRKKYYNMVEDMKGKIRVYCRVRPMSKSEKDRSCEAICKSPDEYTIHVQGTRGLKEFQFDNIFMPEISQEKVFEDTNNLVQSAVDGYNVCIFAYGQTGSGKTYTVIGDSLGNCPGIAPRAFERIYALADEQRAKFSFKVSVYMLELYNDKLLDLFTRGAGEDKMDIKKDKKGMVVIQGAEVKSARNSKELWTLFEEGTKNRHVASTKMNAESSRSHLVVGIVIESTNKVSGQVTKGKLSLVDLAGSERAAKTDASAEQLKEAMSINKSLSALGDVISALSSEQSFIPYRNNKLTMLMQDSLGGNAKTLMFVNVSPADYNADETITSLTYAARVKLITNDASKNADNKEIARLKGVIAKLKKGEHVADEEVDDGSEMVTDD